MTKYIYHSERTKTTCKECLRYDGKVFYDIKDLPQLPIHPNCKCYIETVDNNSDKDRCDCGDRVEVLNTNLLNIIENSNTMQKSIKSEILECAIVLDTNPKSKDFQNLQENFIAMQDKISALVKSTKDLSTDIDMLKEFSYDNTYHTKEQCKMTEGLNKYSKDTTILCKQLNDISEDLKELKEKRKALSKEAERKAKEELEELKKGAQTGGASGAKNIPLPEVSEIEIAVKDNAQSNIKNKAKLLDKIPMEEKSTAFLKPYEDSGTGVRLKGYAEYNETADKNNNNTTNKKSTKLNNAYFSDESLKKARSFIQGGEGYRSNAYKDIAGVWTIGYGHTGRVDGKPITQGMKISKEKAEELYRKDFESHSRVLNEVTVPLTENQKIALASFIYNCGPGAFKTAMLDKLNAGDIKGAADKFDEYIHVTNPKTGFLEPSQGLINRRKREKELFLTPDL